MNELLKDMGQRILDRRKQLNMTQETLANLTHLTSQTISYAETGQKAMRPETMLKICDALGISADYLPTENFYIDPQPIPPFGADH